MTSESQMPNAERRVLERRPAAHSSLIHSLVIRASSLVISVLTLAIRLYQLTISPAQIFLFGPGGGCRFTPSCSEYAKQAIRARGALAGSWLALKRIGRCHPWGGHGHDPAPLKP